MRSHVHANLRGGKVAMTKHWHEPALTACTHSMQVERESQVYESTLQKLNGQLESSLAVMAGEKAALQLSLIALQNQFEGVAQAVYTADDSVVGALPWAPQPVCCAM